eukprot:6845782-Karenia_brevis.AAC.1
MWHWIHKTARACRQSLVWCHSHWLKMIHVSASWNRGGNGMHAGLADCHVLLDFSVEIDLFLSQQ